MMKNKSIEINSNNRTNRTEAGTKSKDESHVKGLTIEILKNVMIGPTEVT